MSGPMLVPVSNRHADRPMNLTPNGEKRKLVAVRRPWAKLGRKKKGVKEFCGEKRQGRTKFGDDRAPYVPVPEESGGGERVVTKREEGTKERKKKKAPERKKRER